MDILAILVIDLNGEGRKDIPSCHVECWSSVEESPAIPIKFSTSTLEGELTGIYKVMRGIESGDNQSFFSVEKLNTRWQKKGKV